MTELSQSPAVTTAKRAEGWSIALPVFGLSLLLLGFAFGSTYATIVSIWWRSGTFTHGFLILPIVAYLIWLKRAELVSLTPRPEPKAVVLILGAAMLWLLSYAADVAVTEQLAAVFMVPILVWIVFGTAVLKRLSFPLGYLFFAVPMGEFLVGPLQDVTAAFTVWALQLTGIPVYWEGRFFHIPSGSFEVAAACSGVRYLIASLALGTLYAYLVYTTLWRRLLFVAMSAVVPIAANGVRAYGVVMLAHLSDYKLAVGVDHLIYGWLFFGVVMFALFWVGSLFREKDGAETKTSAPVDQPVTASGRRTFVLWTVVATGVAISAPGLAAWLESQRANAQLWQPELPAGRNGWEGPYSDASTWEPHFSGAVERRGVYRKGGQKVEVYLAFYPIQTQGAELINSQNRLFDNKASRRLAEGSFQVPLPEGGVWPVHTTQVASEDKSRVVWDWYEVDGDATTNRILAKAYEVRGRLSASHKGSAAWVLSAQYELTTGEAERKLASFVTDMLPALHESLKP